jgi:hypothetical protein
VGVAAFPEASLWLSAIALCFVEQLRRTVRVFGIEPGSTLKFCRVR